MNITERLHPTCNSPHMVKYKHAHNIQIKEKVFKTQVQGYMFRCYSNTILSLGRAYSNLHSLILNAHEE